MLDLFFYWIGFCFCVLASLAGFVVVAFWLMEKTVKNVGLFYQCAFFLAHSKAIIKELKSNKNYKHNAEVE